MRKTLSNIAKKLNREDEPWILAGRTAAVLQGAFLQASNLTIYQTQLGSYRFGEFFAEYKKQRVKYRESDLIAGHVGIFNVNGIEVVVSGQPEIVIEHRKYTLPLEDIYLDIEPEEIDGQLVPMLPMNWLLTIGLVEQDNDLIKGILGHGVKQTEVMHCADLLGAGYYLKPIIESALA